MEFSAQTLEIQMECYEGPLAVLITLIKKNKVSIWDIPISLITEKFLQYVDVVKNLQLKIAEDFIEMASLLIYIKSRMLLPLNNGEEDGTDPREELIERILEYERLKGMVATLETLPVLDRDTYCTGSNTIEGDEEFDLMALCEVFFEIIKNQEERFLEVRDLRPTLEEKLIVLKEILRASGQYQWDYRSEENTTEKVATLLAMLELTKLRIARIIQRKTFGAISIRLRDPGRLKPDSAYIPGTLTDEMTPGSANGAVTNSRNTPGSVF